MRARGVRTGISLVEEAGRLGGKTLIPRTELPGGTILGFLADPEGNAVGLVEEAA